MKIKATKRDTIGKQVKKVRREGQLPASVYGPGRESENLNLVPIEFKKIFEKVGHNNLFELEVDGGKPVKVLVKEVQSNPLTDQFLHVSLYQIDMDKKIVVEVPVKVVGESKAVKTSIGFLVNPMENIKVFCLPEDIPHSIEVDISGLVSINDSISVKDVKLPPKVSLEPNLPLSSVVVKIVPPQKIVETVATETATEATAEAGADEKKDDAKKEEPKK